MLQSPKKMGEGSCQLERQPEQVEVDAQSLRLWFRHVVACTWQPAKLPAAFICLCRSREAVVSSRADGSWLAAGQAAGTSLCWRQGFESVPGCQCAPVLLCMESLTLLLNWDTADQRHFMDACNGPHLLLSLICPGDTEGSISNVIWLPWIWQRPEKNAFFSLT